MIHLPIRTPPRPAAWLTLALAVLTTPAGASPHVGLPHCRVTDLGAALAGPSRAYAISDGGDVVGLNTGDRWADRIKRPTDRESISVGESMGYTNDPKDAVLWRRGVPHLLGTGLGYHQCWAAAVNAKEQVVGTLSTFFDGAYMGTRERAFLWRAGRFTDLGTLPGVPDTEAAAVNKAGAVVGAAVFSSAIPNLDDPAAHAPHAFLWRSGRMRNLGLGRATCVNNRGQVAGVVVREAPTGLPLGDVLRVAAADLTATAWLWEGGRRVTLGEGRPAAMNGIGEAVGVSGPHRAGRRIVDQGRAVLWRGGAATDLGTLGGRGSAACGINARDQVVGWSLDGHGAERAFLWEQGRMYDLNGLIASRRGWTLEEARGINDRGQIVGWGWHDGQERAFLLTPVRKS